MIRITGDKCNIIFEVHSDFASFRSLQNKYIGFARGGYFTYKLSDKGDFVIHRMILVDNISPNIAVEYIPAKFPFIVFWDCLMGYKYGEMHTHPNGYIHTSNQDLISRNKKKKHYKDFKLMIITNKQIGIY